ncbi:sensor histidine kinase [Azospirillum halopraeferens]|uniref:sensor histidine kinase n=1 Tax=Azospirillum halopraeferens TaxID=34010 RepID=UPI0009FF7429|nr:HAMP domain-containing sensor histidine kinase [Azospirillum halopraeferens]
MTVAMRIATGFAVSFALVAVLALIGLAALTGMTREVEGYSAAADAERAAVDAGIAMRELTAAVHDHLAAPTADGFTNAAAQRDAVQERLDALARLVTAPADARAVAEARNGLEGYWTGFAGLAELRGDRDRLALETLEPLVAQMREHLGRLKDAGGVDSATLAGDAAIAVLLMQDHAVRYVDRRSPDDAERMRSELDAARGRLAEMNRYLWVPGTRQLIFEVSGMLDSADAMLDRIAEMLGEEDALRDRALAPNAALVLDRIAEVRSRAAASASALRSGLAAEMGGYAGAALWVGGGVLALGLVMTWFVARSVTRPVRIMSTAMADLAAGRDTVNTLPVLAETTELGAMARSVELLRANTVALERVKREAEELQSRLLAEKERAEADSAAKTDFLVNMGQELHRPLNTIVDASQTLMSELHRLGVGELANEVEAIQWSGEQLVALIDGILDYARIEAGAMDVCVQDFDVARLVAEVRERSLSLADLNGNTLTTTTGQTPGGMSSDFTKVRQILLNLLDNACKFTRGGSVTLDAERIGRDGADWVRFTVTDSGIGFPPAQTGRLFQAFVQGSSRLHKGGKIPGAGLGLTLVGHYCAMLGGDIEVSSTPGTGTRIVVTLPAVYEPPATDRPLLLGAPAGPAGTRPLLTVADTATAAE